MKEPRVGAWVWAAGTAWLVAVGACFALLIAYKSTPGTQTRAPSSWPAESGLEPAHDTATLVMFAHPQCPCTRASIAELGRLLSKLESPPRVYVAFLAPRGVDQKWVESDLWQSAGRLPGARVLVDGEGREAKRFAAATSGATLLYDRSGRLRFAGGITSARGHEGESFGQSRLLAILAGRTADRDDSPVFGCPLEGPGENP